MLYEMKSTYPTLRDTIIKLRKENRIVRSRTKHEKTKNYWTIDHGDEKPPSFFNRSPSTVFFRPRGETTSVGIFDR